MAIPYSRIEQVLDVVGQSLFRVLVRRVSLSRLSARKTSTAIIKFSESQYAIPCSKTLRLGTPAYYRDMEENGAYGIGDSMEATYIQETDFATFLRESGQPAQPRVEHVSIYATHKSDCWIFCASVAPTSPMGIKRLRSSICPDYDGSTLIGDPLSFAKQLGVDFGNAFNEGYVKHLRPERVVSTLLVVVDHGPVVYADSTSDMIEEFPMESRGLVTPFVKRKGFSYQEEYRFVISVPNPSELTERQLDLNVTDELRVLTRMLE